MNYEENTQQHIIEVGEQVGESTGQEGLVEIGLQTTQVAREISLAGIAINYDIIRNHRIRYNNRIRGDNRIDKIDLYYYYLIIFISTLYISFSVDALIRDYYSQSIINEAKRFLCVFIVFNFLQLIRIQSNISNNVSVESNKTNLQYINILYCISSITVRIWSIEIFIQNVGFNKCWNNETYRIITFVFFSNIISIFIYITAILLMIFGFYYCDPLIKRIINDNNRMSSSFMNTTMTNSVMNVNDLHSDVEAVVETINHDTYAEVIAINDLDRDLYLDRDLDRDVDNLNSNPETEIIFAV